MKTGRPRIRTKEYWQEYNRQYRIKNKERQKERMRAYRAAHPRLGQREDNLKYAYGLTLAQYNDMLKEHTNMLN